MQGEETLSGFDAMIRIAEAEKQTLEAEREVLQAQLTSNGDKLRSVNAILKQLLPEEAQKNGHKQKKQQKELNYTPTSERREWMIEWLSGHKGDITAAILQGASGWSNWHTTQMIVWAREAGLTRLSAQQGNLKIYRSLVGEEE